MLILATFSLRITFRNPETTDARKMTESSLSLTSIDKIPNVMEQVFVTMAMWPEEVKHLPGWPLAESKAAVKESLLAAQTRW